MVFKWLQKNKPMTENELLLRQERLESTDAMLRQQTEAEEAIRAERQEKMVTYRMWQQSWTDKQKMNFYLLSGHMITEKGLMQDKMRRPLTNVLGAYEINGNLEHQDRNLMASNFPEQSDWARYMKNNIGQPLIEQLFSHYEVYDLDEYDAPIAFINTLNPIDNAARRAIARGESRVDVQVIKTHELVGTPKKEDEHRFMGIKVK